MTGVLPALHDLIQWLGSNWAFLMTDVTAGLTDVTAGSAGNSERMAFLYARRRVEPSGLACELVVLEEWLAAVSPDALRRQFARPPYVISCRAGQRTFIPPSS